MTNIQGLLPHFRTFAQATINVPRGMPISRQPTPRSGNIIPGIIQLLFSLVIVFSVIYLLWGGISWITSGGNKESLEKAKAKVTYAIIGLFVALLSFTLLFVFGDMFGIDFRMMYIP